MPTRMHSWRKNGQQGFTLIELLVVMVIIGVLAAIAVPTFIGHRKKGGDTAIKSDLTNVAQQLHMYALEKGTYPTDKSWGNLDTLTSAPAIAAIPLSRGVTIRYKYLDPTASKPAGFCLAGYAVKGTSNALGPNVKTNIGHYFWYNSVDGGLTQDPALHSAAPGDC